MNDKRPLVVQYIYKPIQEAYRQQAINTLQALFYKNNNKSNMASIKSIQDILSTYQKAYGAEALMAELAAFQKSPSAPAPSKKVVVVKKGAPASAEAPSSSASSVASEAKEKKVRGPSAWNVYIEKVAGKGKDETPEFSAWKTLQVEKKGNLKMVFAKEQKAADPEGYKSFAAAFEPSVPAPAPSAPAPKPSAPAPKASVPSSSASVSSESSDKKKAGRPKGSKNKAKDAEDVKAESSDSEGEKPKEGEKKKRQWSEEAKKAAAAKRAAKKASKTPEESVKKAAEAAKKPLPESDDESEAEAEMSAVQYNGDDLFWNELTGQCFENIDGALGTLVGTFDGITLTRV